MGYQAAATQVGKGVAIAFQPDAFQLVAFQSGTTHQVETTQADAVYIRGLAIAFQLDAFQKDAFQNISLKPDPFVMRGEARPSRPLEPGKAV